MATIAAAFSAGAAGLASFDASTLLVLAAIYTASAVFSGLSGFGFSAIGALSLCWIPPQLGICMLMLLSVFTQATGLGAMRRELRRQNVAWREGFLPYAAGGILGLPVGLEILARAPSRGLVCTLGSLLVAYAAYNAFKPRLLRLPACETCIATALAVGAIGGIVGGFSAFPGGVLVIWNGLKNVSKERGRALTQPFILSMQVIALAIVACARPTMLLDARLFALLLASLPLAWVGNRIGIEIYRRTSRVSYRRVTLAALGFSGFSLVLKSIVFA
jgi:uncharacterized membrane protein YfcA